MLFESGCLAYAGFAQIALARPKYRAVPSLPHIRPALRRALGWIALMLSLVPPTIGLGGPQGLVTWAGAISLAALTLVLLMSRWPTVALQTSLYVGFVAIPLFLFF